MTHKHSANQGSKSIRSSKRTKLIEQLSSLLWDASKPAGQEGVPEDQWEAVLIGPANDDKELIAEVCAYERYLRSDPKDDPFELEVAVPRARYLEFVFGFFLMPEFPIQLLWDIEKSDWEPEEKWDQLLEQWIEGDPATKESIKELAREFKKVRETERYTYRM